jgi:hypothetical protein
MYNFNFVDQVVNPQAESRSSDRSALAVTTANMYVWNVSASGPSEKPKVVRVQGKIGAVTHW